MPSALSAEETIGVDQHARRPCASAWAHQSCSRQRVSAAISALITCAFRNAAIAYGPECGTYPPAVDAVVVARRQAGRSAVREAHARRIHQHDAAEAAGGVFLDEAAKRLEDLAERGALGDHLEQRFLARQQRLRALAIFDVGVRAVPLDDPAALVVHRATRIRIERYSPSNRRNRASASPAACEAWIPASVPCTPHVVGMNGIAPAEAARLVRTLPGEVELRRSGIG